MLWTEKSKEEMRLPDNPGELAYLYMPETAHLEEKLDFWVIQEHWHILLVLFLWLNIISTVVIVYLLPVLCLRFFTVKTKSFTITLPVLLEV